ncbi:MAG TPA: transcriptional repressor [Pyrinomonadaceae bacterium]|nr:transcriptional repressor [Pyrinomonadaceae bacterium]
MTKEDNLFAEEKDIFLNYVQKYGLRRTAQRDLILEVFLRTEEHLSSEALYDLVKQEDPTVGQTTVYRTLKLLTEAGLAREVRFGDNRTHYEHHYNHEHHDHMICTECGKIIEFFSAELEAMQDEIAAKYNFTITQHSLRMLGLCEDCETTAKTNAASGIQPRVRVSIAPGQHR